MLSAFPMRPCSTGPPPREATTLRSACATTWHGCGGRKVMVRMLGKGVAGHKIKRGRHLIAASSYHRGLACLAHFKVRGNLAHRPKARYHRVLELRLSNHDMLSNIVQISTKHTAGAGRCSGKTAKPYPLNTFGCFSGSKPSCACGNLNNVVAEKTSMRAAKKGGGNKATFGGMGELLSPSACVCEGSGDALRSPTPLAATLAGRDCPERAPAAGVAAKKSSEAVCKPGDNDDSAEGCLPYPGSAQLGGAVTGAMPVRVRVYVTLAILTLFTARGTETLSFVSAACIKVPST